MSGHDRIALMVVIMITLAIFAAAAVWLPTL
jgi:hypothetical protein